MRNDASERLRAWRRRNHPASRAAKPQPALVPLDEWVDANPTGTRRNPRPKDLRDNVERTRQAIADFMDRVRRRDRR